MASGGACLTIGAGLLELSSEGKAVSGKELLVTVASGLTERDFPISNRATTMHSAAKQRRTPAMTELNPEPRPAAASSSVSRGRTLPEHAQANAPTHPMNVQ